MNTTPLFVFGRHNMQVHKLSVTTDVSGDGSATTDYEVFAFCLGVGLDYAGTAAAGTDVTISVSDPEGPARTLLTVTDNNSDGWYKAVDPDIPFKGELKVVVAQGGNAVADCVAVTFYTDDRVSVGTSSPADGTYIGDIKFGESLPAGTNNIGDMDVLSLPGSVQGPGNPSVDSYAHAVIDLAASTADQVLVAAPGASKQIWVFGIFMMADTAAGTVTLQDEDNTALSGTMAVSDEGGWVLPPSGNFAMPWFKCVTNKALECDTGAATIDGIICYAIVSV